MAYITLYIPNSPSPEEYEVEVPPNVDSAGVLRFRVDNRDVVTTVPFLVRYPVKAKAMISQSPPRRRITGHTEWS